MINERDLLRTARIDRRAENKPVACVPVAIHSNGNVGLDQLRGGGEGEQADRAREQAAGISGKRRRTEGQRNAGGVSGKNHQQAHAARRFHPMKTLLTIVLTFATSGHAQDGGNKQQEGYYNGSVKDAIAEKITVIDSLEHEIQINDALIRMHLNDTTTKP